MDKFGKEKAKARDLVKTKGAYPKGIDIHKDDEFLDEAERQHAVVGRRASREDPTSVFVYFGELYIRRDAVPALLHAQRHGLSQWYLFEPTPKRKSVFRQSLRAAGFRGRQISGAFIALTHGLVIPDPH